MNTTSLSAAGIAISEAMEIDDFSEDSRINPANFSLNRSQNLSPVGHSTPVYARRSLILNQSANRSHIAVPRPSVFIWADFINNPEKQEVFQKTVRGVADDFPGEEVGNRPQRRDKTDELFKEFIRRLPELPQQLSPDDDVYSDIYDEFTRRIQNRYNRIRNRKLPVKKDPCKKCVSAFQAQNLNLVKVPTEIAESENFRTLLDSEPDVLEEKLEKFWKSEDETECQKCANQPQPTWLMENFLSSAAGNSKPWKSQSSAVKETPSLHINDIPEWLISSEYFKDFLTKMHDFGQEMGEKKLRIFCEAEDLNKFKNRKH